MDLYRRQYDRALTKELVSYEKTGHQNVEPVHGFHHDALTLAACYC